LERATIAKKAQEAKELAELIDKYSTVLIASLHKVRAIQIQELSKKFRDDVKMKVAKSSTLQRALEASSKPTIKELESVSTGSNVLLLTNLNPFKLSIQLDRSKSKMGAKAGDIAPSDITVPAGNTGLPPGPAISELNEAGIRTRIESGSVYVLRDTVVAKKGEAIQPRVASVLTKLGIKPLEVGLNIKAAYDSGVFIKGDDIHLDLDQMKKDFEEGFGRAFALSVNASFLIPENATSILGSAQRNGLSLALNSNYPIAETVSTLLGKAQSNATILSNSLKF
jgi:large subunit ribosomal protein L10